MNTEMRELTLDELERVSGGLSSDPATLEGSLAYGYLAFAGSVLPGVGALLNTVTVTVQAYRDIRNALA